MGRVEDGMPYRWGQLYAALVAMRSLAGTGRIAPASPREVAATTGNPYNDCKGLLREVGLHLFAARERGGTSADAAVVIMDDIARLTPPRRESRGTLDQQEAKEFVQGHEDRFAAYRKAWEPLTG
ncbi:hypothetical protein ABZ618_08415 [Streptomyces roseolus]|uniref:hypothetical protein n=1 Tax=Streptomyces roseolus TaxID=67358 RepID=UPI00340A419D